MVDDVVNDDVVGRQDRGEDNGQSEIVLAKLFLGYQLSVRMFKKILKKNPW